VSGIAATVTGVPLVARVAMAGGNPDDVPTTIPGINYVFDGGVYVWGDNNFPLNRVKDRRSLNENEKDLNKIKVNPLLTFRESLRDIEVCLRAQNKKLYHMGIRGLVSRNTLANANKVRNWKIYADFAQRLISIARRLYLDDAFNLELENTAYALDASTIDLCLSVFPWAQFRKTKAAIKLHTLLDLRGNIPTFIHITDGKVHDVNILDILVTEPGSFYVMDRGYLDFSRLYTMHLNNAYFVIRAKSNTKIRRLYSHPVDKDSGLICDQTIRLSGIYTSKDYPENLRRIKYFDSETGKTFVFLTNNKSLSALTVTELYRYRWQVELFFKWIKQNLRIKAFYGTSENAVKTQIWIAVSVYVTVAIIKKRMNLDISLYTMLQILSITVFNKTPLLQLFTNTSYENKITTNDNQLKLFD
jgi:hypothetical protein